MDNENFLKCVVVGDGAIGKTCLLVSFTTNEFPEDYVPTVFDNFNTDITLKLPNIEETKYSLSLFDTAGQEDFDRLRPLSYPLTDVFLICFSIVRPSSFLNIKEKWIPEIEFYCPNTSFILVGLQSDLRDHPEIIEKLRTERAKPIDRTRAEKLAKTIGAKKYMECSAYTQVFKI